MLAGAATHQGCFLDNGMVSLLPLGESCASRCVWGKTLHLPETGLYICCIVCVHIRLLNKSLFCSYILSQFNLENNSKIFCCFSCFSRKCSSLYFILVFVYVYTCNLLSVTVFWYCLWHGKPNSRSPSCLWRNSLPITWNQCPAWLLYPASVKVLGSFTTNGFKILRFWQNKQPVEL